jgi:hypothetical protein
LSAASWFGTLKAARRCQLAPCSVSLLATKHCFKRSNHCLIMIHARYIS